MKASVPCGLCFRQAGMESMLPIRSLLYQTLLWSNKFLRGVQPLFLGPSIAHGASLITPLPFYHKDPWESSCIFSLWVFFHFYHKYFLYFHIFCYCKRVTTSNKSIEWVRMNLLFCMWTWQCPWHFSPPLPYPLFLEVHWSHGITIEHMLSLRVICVPIAIGSH